MAEELKIVIQDDGPGAPSAGPQSSGGETPAEIVKDGTSMLSSIRDVITDFLASLTGATEDIAKNLSEPAAPIFPPSAPAGRDRSNDPVRPWWISAEDWYANLEAGGNGYDAPLGFGRNQDNVDRYKDKYGDQWEEQLKKEYGPGTDQEEKDIYDGYLPKGGYEDLWNVVNDSVDIFGGPGGKGASAAAGGAGGGGASVAASAAGGAASAAAGGAAGAAGGAGGAAGGAAGAAGAAGAGGAAGAAATATAALAAAAGPIGIAVAGLVVLSIEIEVMRRIVSELNDEFLKMERELRDVTPILVAAAAGREIEEIRQNMARGERFGPELAMVANANHEMALAMTRLKDEFLAPLLTIFAPIARDAANITVMLGDFAGMFYNISNNTEVLKVLLGAGAEQLPFIGKIIMFLRILARVAERDESEDPAGQDLINKLFGSQLGQEQKGTPARIPQNAGFGGPLGKKR